MATLPILTGDEVYFEPSAHAYTDVDGEQVMSITQAITFAGLIDYSAVAPAVLELAAWRGRLVHQAAAILDRGGSLSDYVIPAECEPYVVAYARFVRDMQFRPDPAWIEKPMVVTLFGIRVAMTPDAVGTIAGVPTVVERKCTSAFHPSWAIQTAGQALALRSAGVQVRDRVAVQLLKTGKYRMHTFSDPNDFQVFGDSYRVAAWKVKHGLVRLDR